MLGWVQLQCLHRGLRLVRHIHEGERKWRKRGEAEGGMTVIGATRGGDHAAGLLLPMRVEGMREVEESEVEARGGKATPGERAAAAGEGWTQAGWVGGGARGGRASVPGGVAEFLEGSRGSA